MSITDELREWAKMLTHWWYDPVKDEYTYTTGTMPPSIDAIRLDSSIIAIADRIDAEHERLMQEQPFTVDMVPMTDERMAEHGWIRLPKDADGEPIHVGDKVTCARSVWQVTGLRLTGLAWGVCCTIFNDHGGSGTNVYPPCDLRHYHAPTVEDVLREFTDAILEWSGKSGTVAEVGTWSDVASEYAAKLRLAEGEDA